MKSLLPRVRNGFLEPTFDDMYDMFDKFFAETTPKLNNNKFKVDLQNNESEYVIDAEMPGVSKDNINLSLENDHLVLGCETTKEEDKSEANYVHRERSFASMQRRFYLPNADVENIEAKLENGLLNVRIPEKSKDSKQIQIEIK